MPDILVTNPNFDGSSITVNVDLVSIVPKNELGDHKYIFTIGTFYKDTNGDSIDPIYVHSTSIKGFWDSLPDALESICSKIGWGEYKTDNVCPYVNYYSPKGEDVSLYSSVVVNIKDDYPSTGIDVDSIKVYINNIDVTEDIVVDGSYNDLKLMWNPKKRALK